MPTSSRPIPGDAQDIFEQLKQQIESFAPQETAYREGREVLYSDLESIDTPKDTESYGADTRVFVLKSICSAQQLGEERAKEGKLLRWYREEVRRVEKLIEQVGYLLEEIAGSPVVRFGPGPDEESIKESILFYKLAEIQCPHGRPWKVCVEARRLLTRLEQTSPPLKAWLLQKLRDMDIDPATQADRLCTSEPVIAIRGPGSISPIPFPAVVVTPGEGSSSPRPTARAGRLPNALANFLVDRIVGCLKSAGWESEESYCFLRDVIIYCFGADVSAAALGKQWHRRHPAKTHI